MVHYLIITVTVTVIMSIGIGTYKNHNEFVILCSYTDRFYDNIGIKM